MTINTDRNSNGNGTTTADGEKEYQVPERYLRISQETRELAAKPRRDLLWSAYRLGEAIRNDLDKAPTIHISDDEELRMLADACGEHSDILESCVRLSERFTTSEFERIVEETHLCYGQVISLALIGPATEREELLRLAIQNKWTDRELSKEIRRRYLPPKVFRPNPPPRSVKQARERLSHQSKKYLELLQKLFGKFGYNLATNVVNTPSEIIKSELPTQLAECIDLLQQIGAETAKSIENLKYAANYAAGAIAARNAQSARKLKTRLLIRATQPNKLGNTEPKMDPAFDRYNPHRRQFDPIVDRIVERAYGIVRQNGYGELRTAHVLFCALDEPAVIEVLRMFSVDGDELRRIRETCANVSLRIAFTSIPTSRPFNPMAATQHWNTRSKKQFAEADAI